LRRQSISGEAEDGDGVERVPEKRHAHFEEEGSGSDRQDDVDEKGDDDEIQVAPVPGHDYQTPETLSHPDSEAPDHQTSQKELTRLTIPAAAHTTTTNDQPPPPEAPSSTSLSRISTAQDPEKPAPINPYTEARKVQPPNTFLQQLRPWNGRINSSPWPRVFIRPFILFCYPSILWSTLVYSLSIGWLIVLSESVSTIYMERDTYNFTPLQTGLVYISPFVGGVLGTAVAGKVSDRIVRYMARKNDGVYEPEFRLVMALPIALTTVIGLMGYGWSAQERDAWIVPTIFFGLISFGCSLGSTTAITFAVDSYRQYAGEALVTLNFSKNIFHGLVFSLFFNKWLDGEGSRDTFVAIGGIQLACLLTTIPMYIYGKRARMWTVRRNMMERW
jgi:hypothetical protein